MRKKKGLEETREEFLHFGGCSECDERNAESWHFRGGGICGEQPGPPTIQKSEGGGGHSDRDSF